MSASDSGSSLADLLDLLDEAPAEDQGLPVRVASSAPKAVAVHSNDRDALLSEGAAVSLAALRVLRATFEAGEADFDDAIKAIPAAHRVLEHAEKMEVARRDGDKPGAVMHITFDLSGAGVSIHQGPIEVATAKELPALLPASREVVNTADGSFAWDFEPEHDGGIS